MSMMMIKLIFKSAQSAVDRPTRYDDDNDDDNDDDESNFIAVDAWSTSYCSE